MRTPQTEIRIPGRPTRGFTLVELLVVMSVIAILAGMLIPILTSARTAAKHGATTHILGQVATALGRYSEDCGGFPPDTPNTTAPIDTHVTGFVAPELLYYYLCSSNLSSKHPYLEPQAGTQVCDFTWPGATNHRLVDPRPPAQPLWTETPNKRPEIADAWQHPIYYDITDPHTPMGFDIWSGGKNLRNDNGSAGTDDIRGW